MGHYTRFSFKAKLQKDTPKEVLDILHKTIVEKDIGVTTVMFNSSDVPKPDIDHKFFDCERWHMLFLCNNWDVENIPGSTLDNAGKYLKISIDTEFKNYDSEIEHFINWISPYVINRKKKYYLGYWKPESSNIQFNIYINEKNEPDGH